MMCPPPDTALARSRELCREKALLLALKSVSFVSPAYVLLRKVPWNLSVYFPLQLPPTPIPPSSHMIFKLPSQLVLPELGSSLSLSYIYVGESDWESRGRRSCRNQDFWGTGWTRSQICPTGRGKIWGIYFTS